MAEGLGQDRTRQETGDRDRQTEREGGREGGSKLERIMLATSDLVLEVDISSCFHERVRGSRVSVLSREVES